MAENGKIDETEIQARIEHHTLDLLAKPPISRARDEGAAALLASVSDADEASKALFPDVGTEVALNALAGKLDVLTHLQLSFMRGALDSADVIFFLAWTGLFLFAATRIVEGRRMWS